MKTVIAFIVGALLAGGVVWSITAKQQTDRSQASERANELSSTVNPEQLIERVRAQNPQFANSSIRFMRNLSEFGFPGLYEIMLANQGMVVNANADYAVVGDLFALENITNLSTAFRNQQIAELAATEIANVDPDILVTYPANNDVPELGTIWVFTDPTCPYCQRLHEQQAQLAAAGVTLAYIPYPRNGLGGGRDHQQLLQIMCAEDTAAAMHDFKTAGDTSKYALANDNAACGAAVTAGYELGQRIGISGTPFIIKSTGGVIPGFNSAAAIIQQMRNPS